MNNLDVTKSITDMDSFIGKLKKEDKRLYRIYKSIKILYLVLLVIFIPIFYLELQKGGTIQIIRVASFFLGFSSIAILFGYMQKRLSIINYTVPTLCLLKTTVKRYKPFSLKDVVALVGFTLIMFGITINEKIYSAYMIFKQSGTTWGTYLNKFWHSLTNTEINLGSFLDIISEYPLVGALGSIIFIIFLIIISSVFGYFLWKERYKPIRNNAIALIKEIES